MSKQIDKFKDENTVDNQPIVTDTTPGYGQVPLEQKISNRGFRFLGITDGRIDNPKSGDAIYNIQSNQIEIFRQQYYRGYGVQEAIGPINWSVGDQVMYLGDLWEAVAPQGSQPAQLPSPPNFVLVNKIRGRVSDESFYAQNGSQILIDPSGNLIGGTSGQGISNQPSSLLDYGVKVPYDGQYLIIAQVEYNVIGGDAEKRLEIRQQNISLPPAISIIDAVDDRPPILTAPSGSVTRGLIDNYRQTLIAFARLEAGFEVFAIASHTDGPSRLAETKFTIFQV